MWERLAGFCRHNEFMLIGLSTASAVARGLELVLFVRLAIQLRHFAWALSQLMLPLAQLILWSAAAATYRCAAGRATGSGAGLSGWQAGGLGALGALGQLLATAAASQLPGSVQTALLQAALPVTMLLAAALLRTRYQPVHFAAAALILVGALLGLVPALAAADDGWAHPLVWAALLFVAQLPLALATVYTEHLLRAAGSGADPWLAHLRIAVAQLAFGLLSLPLVMVPLLRHPADPPAPRSLADVGRYLGQALACLFAGRNTDGHAGEHCGGSLALLCLLMLLWLPGRLLPAAHLTYESALPSSLAAAVLGVTAVLRVLVATAGFLWPSLAGVAAQEALGGWGLAAVGLLCAGLLLYRTRDEQTDAAYQARLVELHTYKQIRENERIWADDDDLLVDPDSDPPATPTAGAATAASLPNEWTKMPQSS